jgi:hypothetical protein
MILYQDGLKVEARDFELPGSPRHDFDSCYVFALPRSGSVMLNNVVSVLMAENGVPVVDLPSFCFMHGIVMDTVILNYAQLFRPKGYCYAGFRAISTGMRGIVDQLPGKKILMVRDPRDMLVSLYYSLKLSHKFPKNGTVQFFSALNTSLEMTAATSIDAFCVAHIGIYLHILGDYMEFVDSKSVMVVRYEDIVFDKVGLALMLRDWFSLDIDAVRCRQMVAPFDVIPGCDRPADHIRQVLPGDHKRKLRPSTIDILNGALENFIRRFNY